MDKVVFLESLSFLTKQEAYPPPKNENVLLESILVSIEVDKHGPVLLKNAADPAMFPCKISFFQSGLGSPSSESTSFSFSQGETPRTGESDSKQQHKPTLQLLLQLLKDGSDESNNMIYRVDASQLQHVKLIKSSGKDFPASIVMMFQGDCNLRLFSLTPTDKLAAVYNFLDTKLSRLAAPPQVKGDGGGDDDLESATRQSLKTLQQGWNETEQLLSKFGASKRVEEELSQRLNKAASSLSHVPSSQRDHFELVQNERLEQTQEQVEELLTAYFPRANKKRRRLNNNSSEDSATSAKSSTDQLAPIDREECLESAQKLLQQTRRLLQQRHEVAFLPLRG